MPERKAGRSAHLQAQKVVSNASAEKFRLCCEIKSKRAPVSMTGLMYVDRLREASLYHYSHWMLYLTSGRFQENDVTPQISFRLRKTFMKASRAIDGYMTEYHTISQKACTWTWALSDLLQSVTSTTSSFVRENSEMKKGNEGGLRDLLCAN